MHSPVSSSAHFCANSGIMRSNSVDFAWLIVSQWWIKPVARKYDPIFSDLWDITFTPFSYLGPWIRHKFSSKIVLGVFPKNIEDKFKDFWPTTKPMQPNQQRFDFHQATSSHQSKLKSVRTELQPNKLDKYLRGTQICKAVACGLAPTRLRLYRKGRLWRVPRSSRRSGLKTQEFESGLNPKLRWESEGATSGFRKRGCMKIFAGTGKKWFKTSMFCDPGWRC